ncbi:hypothetical protein [Euzebya rosea]|uniref:hypothetical protein n=1 Tax=Euzebya rosea TaxID=2052804 RepID=UPI000D3E16B7|nr:hypothetical protein [Euzebya rosea]
MHPLTTSRPRAAAIAATALLILATGCSSAVTSAEQTEFSDPQSVNPAATSDPVDGDRVGADAIITGRDYVFEGIPDVVNAGDSIAFVNASLEEAHELVVFPIDEDETRPAEELWQALDPTAEPVLVSVAGPSADGQLYVGDGTITEPGRYLAVCFLPVGGDPDLIFEQDGPVEGDEPPHASVGMVAEIVVEA